MDGRRGWPEVYVIDAEYIISLLTASSKFIRTLCDELVRDEDELPVWHTALGRTRETEGLTFEQELLKELRRIATAVEVPAPPSGNAAVVPGTRGPGGRRHGRAGGGRAPAGDDKGSRGGAMGGTPSAGEEWGRWGG